MVSTSEEVIFSCLCDRVVSEFKGLQCRVRHIQRWVHKICMASYAEKVEDAILRSGNRNFICISIAYVRIVNTGRCWDRWVGTGWWTSALRFYIQLQTAAGTVQYLRETISGRDMLMCVCYEARYGGGANPVTFIVAPPLVLFPPLLPWPPPPPQGCRRDGIHLPHIFPTNFSLTLFSQQLDPRPAP